jgi:hypothetical protein
MGTTQRIVPGVTGEPNWRQLSRSISAVAANVRQGLEIQDELGDTEGDEVDVQSQEFVRLTQRQQAVNNRQQNHIQAAMKNLIKTGGGRNSITRGQSASLGRSGRRIARRLSTFVQAVHERGLEAVLQEVGFDSLEGKSLQEVLDFLLIYFTDTAYGMDEVAANVAACQTLEWICQGIGTVEELQTKLEELIDQNGLTQVIALFFGIYLFEHLSQRFEEKLIQLKGDTLSRETFTLIREDIIGRIEVLASEQELRNIDWRGAEGNHLADSIFNSIINLFE